VTPATRAAWATFAVFAFAGLGLSTWLARLPAVRDALALRPAQMGLILLAGSIGSTVALPLTGWVIQRIGIRRTVGGGVLTMSLALSLAAVAVARGEPVLLAALLFLAFGGAAVWDVAMNLQGTLVEQALGRSIMPRFHAGYSLGTILGAVLGAAAARLGVPLLVHIPVAAALLAGGALTSLRCFLPDRPPPDDGARPGAFSAWGERRTLLVGVVVLAAGLAEGAANDWVALAVVDGFDESNATGALAFALFVTAMTLMRVVGTRLLERHGRVVVLLSSTMAAVLGLGVFTLAPGLPLALGGAVLWGAGAALGFPVGMSAASDDPARAAVRLSVVSTIGYTAFIAGPPLLGLLAEQHGYRLALLFVALPLLASLVAIPATRPLAPHPIPADPREGSLPA